MESTGGIGSAITASMTRSPSGSVRRHMHPYGIGDWKYFGETCEMGSNDLGCVYDDSRNMSCDSALRVVPRFDNFTEFHPFKH